MLVSKTCSHYILAHFAHKYSKSLNGLLFKRVLKEHLTELFCNPNPEIPCRFHMLLEIMYQIHILSLIYTQSFTHIVNIFHYENNKEDSDPSASPSTNTTSTTFTHLLGFLGLPRNMTRWLEVINIKRLVNTAIQYELKGWVHAVLILYCSMSLTPFNLYDSCAALRIMRSGLGSW